MLDVIEKLLILQDRDRKLLRTQEELAHIEPERQEFRNRLTTAQAKLDAAKHRVKQIESDRKKLELDVDAKKEQIDRYSVQQFQTKKNEEYRALAHEIEMCKEAIRKIEDQQLELMEQAELASHEMNEATKAASVILKDIESAKATITDKETRLKKELEILKADYEQLQSAVDEEVREKYLRIRRAKGANTVVGVQHSVCGGCHVKLPMQVVLSCQAQQELVTCPNCGRILYFTREMDTAVAG